MPIKLTPNENESQPMEDNAVELFPAEPISEPSDKIPPESEKVSLRKDTDTEIFSPEEEENSPIELDMPDGGMLQSFRTEPVARKITPIFFLIDVSGSMEGVKIGTVNSAMEEIMNDLKNIESSDSELRFAVLSFGTGVQWVTGESGLIPCDGSWNTLTADGFTYFNSACRELKDKLSGNHGFFKFAARRTITPPILILMTDGYANDGDRDGNEGLSKLRENKYFRGSYKIAIAIGNDANQRLCENFTGDKELVFTAYNANALKVMIDAVVKGSVTVSSAGVADAPNPDPVTPDSATLIQTVQNEMNQLNPEENNNEDESWD
ncbi:MAG: vWA domain-containing protein [Oscillospiraceae bacterium]